MAVRRCFLAFNGSPCLRHCGHGATIGDWQRPGFLAQTLVQARTMLKEVRELGRLL
jgi:hypothetical protein